MTNLTFVFIRLQKLCARKSWNDALDSSKGNRLKGIEREQAFLQLGQVRNCKAHLFLPFPFRFVSKQCF